MYQSILHAKYILADGSGRILNARLYNTVILRPYMVNFYHILKMLKEQLITEVPRAMSHQGRTKYGYAFKPQDIPVFDRLLKCVC